MSFKLDEPCLKGLGKLAERWLWNARVISIRNTARGVQALRQGEHYGHN